MFCPKVVVAVTENLAETAVPPPPPVPPPVPVDPVWMAMALRAGTVAVKVPPETVILQGGCWSSKRRVKGMWTYAVPVHAPLELLPLITSQYVPAAKDVVNVADQADPSLLIATNPADPTETKREHQRSNKRREGFTSTESNPIRLG